MARPQKAGLEYFPLDCRIDDKITMLEAEHGIEGFGVYIRLLQYCYQFSDGKLDMSVVFRWKTLGKTLGIPSENLRKMVDTMLEIDLFDRKVFEGEQKLTSSGIQKRLSRVSELRNNDRTRKEKPAPDDSKDFSDGKQKISNRKSTQSKRDTTVSLKEKKERVRAPEKISYRPHVNLLEAEYQTLIEKYGQPFAEACLDRLENGKVSKGYQYSSDYGAINSWVVRAVNEDLARMPPVSHSAPQPIGFSYSRGTPD